MQSIKKNKVKSPLNYIGGKTKILNQIIPLFPKEIDTFVDLFAGGCNVGINVNANMIIFNDNLIFLVDMFETFLEKDINYILHHIENRIKQFNLSLTNEVGYKEIRKLYNLERNPLDLFVLVSFSFNHQIRFNNNHQYNNPFGRERSSFNKTMRQNLEKFVYKLKSIEVIFSKKDFEKFDFSTLKENDFVYCDPPYLITTGTYNDGKRGFKGWSIKEELALLNRLDNLSQHQIKFGLSNVIEHKGKSNDILKEWLNKNPSYIINYIDFDYSNSNYQSRVKTKKSSIEVLITNYQPKKINKTLSLFD